MGGMHKQTITTNDVGEVPAEIGLKEVPHKAPRTAKLKAELQSEESRLEAELRPHRELYEKHCNDEAYLKAKAEIKRIGLELGEIKNELAALARAKSTNKAMQAEPGVIGVKE